MSIEKHMLSMGKLFENFSKTAASNPYSFYGTERSALELSTVTDENRWISFPYPKWMNARDSVNQGAAVLMTSVKMRVLWGLILLSGYFSTVAVRRMKKSMLLRG